MKTFNLFKVLTSFTALLCGYLFYLLCFSPNIFLFDLGVEGSEAAYFISRRAGILMLGISILMFFARNVPHSQARQAIALSIAVTMFGLAIASTYELMRGLVGNAIFGAIVIESILASSFFYLWISHFKKTTQLAKPKGMKR
jgi:O-antigen/teichoic acid export membrane protein